MAAIRLLILTGARLREILHAKRSDVDRGRGILFLSDSKTGRKPIYLSAAVMALLDEIPQVGRDSYIVAGGKEHRTAKGERIYKPRADLKRPWAAIRRAAGLEDVTLHHLRHSYLATRPQLHPEAPLFTNDKFGGEWVYSTLCKWHGRIRAAAGLPKMLQLQDFRRTAQTEAGGAGGTADEIRGLARHKTRSAAEHYVHPDGRYVESVQAKRLASRQRLG